MLLVAVCAAAVVSAFLWRLMRRLVLGIALACAVVWFVAKIPSTNANLVSYRLLVGLFGHVIATSIQHGVAQYVHWGRGMLAHHHL